MSYYKIIFESDTIEGLKAIQGSFTGGGASATEATASETPVPPPQQGNENADVSFGVVQAPPPAANGADADPSFSNDIAFNPPPPPNMADSAAMDISLEEGNPPPPPQK